LTKTRLVALDDLADRTPSVVSVDGVDLMVIRDGEQAFVLYGRCLHKGAPLANGTVVGRKIICAWHGWGYRYDSGQSDSSCPALARFDSWIEDGQVCVDRDQVRAWYAANPQPYPGA
jgi:nitrite reductase/ring-hydroxylating ferredoxin subunit